MSNFITVFYRHFNSKNFEEHFKMSYKEMNKDTDTLGPSSCLS